VVEYSIKKEFMKISSTIGGGVFHLGFKKLINIKFNTYNHIYASYINLNLISLYKNIQTNINNQINPPIIQPPLPWATALA
jgi:hypothetical protein